MNASICPAGRYQARGDRFCGDDINLADVDDHSNSKGRCAEGARRGGHACSRPLAGRSRSSLCLLLAEGKHDAALADFDRQAMADPNSAWGLPRGAATGSPLEGRSTMR